MVCYEGADLRLPLVHPSVCLHMHVYSVDEVMIDVTNYLETYHCTARELIMKMILDVLYTTGITATAGQQRRPHHGDG